MKSRLVGFLIVSLCALSFQAQALPGAPTDPFHPGSKVYSHAFDKKKMSCSGRDITLYLPKQKNARETFPVVVFGHGQALNDSHYQLTFEHLAKKGVATIFPMYDNGFFDQDWSRMGKDYATLTDCAVRQNANILDENRVIYSGHSKGAYVASIAMGVSSAVRPKIVILLDAAGFDARAVQQMDPNISLTVVFAEADTTVKKEFSDNIYASSPSMKKQYILLKSYSGGASDSLVADHYWPQSKALWSYGRDGESPFHYYGSWKWLVGAAEDLSAKGEFTNKYLFGDESVNKGVPGQQDEVVRNF